LKGIKEGQRRLSVTTSEGKELKAMLTDVLYVPDLRFNLLSIGKLREKGTITYDGKGAAFQFPSGTKIPFTPILGNTVFGLHLF
jgi:hypothetical protein